MKLTKALSLILTLAMLLGTFAIGITAAVDQYDTVLFPGLEQTDDGSNGYVAPTDENRTEIPGNAMTMTALKESGQKTNTMAVADRHFTISNADEMVIFSELVNASDPFYMANVYLTGNIDMTSVTNFTPIGNTQTTEGSAPAYYFRGVFDGRGYEIQNLVMTSNGGDYTNVALFGCVRGGAIINLVIADSCSFTYTGTSSNARTASVVAWTVSVGGDGNGGSDDTALNPEGESGANYAVAYYYKWNETVKNSITSLVMNVKNNATVNGGAGYAGGIVATTNAHTGYRAMIMKCTQAADVTGNVAGGILGAMLGNNGSRIVHVIECQVKANSNKTVKITGNTADACANTILGTVDKGNFGDFNSAEVRNSSTGFDYDVRGYSFKNVKRVDTSAMPNLNDYDSNTSAASFKITNAAGMLKLATLVNNGNKLSGKTIYLANDIDWAADENKDVAMVTIGGDPTAASVSAYVRDSANYFSGTFDGQGYVIDNLKMSFTTNFGGLFGVLRGGTVKNMVLGDGCEFYSTGKWVAPIAGMCVYGGIEVQVINCYSAATVTKPEKNVAAGMVATVGGFTNAAYAKILYCTNAGNVTAGWTVGAMLGYAERPAYVNYCVNTGEITATAGDGKEAGAMVGSFVGASGQFVNNLTTTAVSSPNTAAAFDPNFGTRNGSWVQTGNLSSANADAASLAILNQVASGLNYAGYQTKTEGGKVTAVRILATVNSLEAAKVGFMLTANDVIYDYSTTTVYGSVLASNDGLEYSVQAETLGGKYVVAVTITGIPAEGTTITLVPYADSNYGAEVSIELN